MSETTISLSDTKKMQEEARQKYADGQYTLEEYLAVILNNPLRFRSTKRTQAVIVKDKGKFLITANQPQKNISEED